MDFFLISILKFPGPAENNASGAESTLLQSKQPQLAVRRGWGWSPNTARFDSLKKKKKKNLHPIAVPECFLPRLHHHSRPLMVGINKTRCNIEPNYQREAYVEPLVGLGAFWL